VKGPVTDRFKLAGFDENFLNEHIFLSADEAIRKLSSAGQMDAKNTGHEHNCCEETIEQIVL
jgi:hypothetical protein